MNNFKKNLITTALLAVLTLSASLFTASNFPVQVAVAQTTGNTSGGPQDGGDGRKRPCRPPQCTNSNSNSGNTQNRSVSSQTNVTNENESSDWWDGFIDWLFGE
jgi:hypothetical protein